MEPEKNFLDHLAVLARWRRMILVTCFTVSVLTAGISLIITPVYRSSAVLFPPSESQGSLGISAILEKLPVGMLGLGESGVSATEFVPILKSQRVAEAIIRRFNLQEAYEAETREELLQMVDDRLEVELSREQFLTVSYEAETPEGAAEIANAFVEGARPRAQAPTRTTGARPPQLPGKTPRAGRGPHDRSRTGLQCIPKRAFGYRYREPDQGTDRCLFLTYRLNAGRNENPTGKSPPSR